MILSAVRRDLQYRLAGWPLGMALPSGFFLFCFFLLIPFVCGSAQENKACSNLIDREALRRVKTFCVDTSAVEAGVASDIKAFVARENQPGQLLKRMTWELTDQCAAADGVIRVYFSPSDRHRTETYKDLNGGVTSSDFHVPMTQVVLLVYDRASVSPYF